MKILYINEFFTEVKKTGANVVAYFTYNIMKKYENEVYFFANSMQPFLVEQKINKYFPFAYGYNSLGYRINSLYNYKSQYNLERVLDIIKPDIVHIHAIEELSYSILKSIYKRKIPFVITVHDASFACPVMGTKQQFCTLCSNSIMNCVKNKCSRNNYFCSLYMAVRFMINKYLLKKYKPSKLILPSQALADYIRITKFDNNVPIVVLPNVLDEAFNDIKPSYTNKKYFLFVGSLLDEKGVNILLNAIKCLPSEIDFHIVGSGKDEKKYKEFVSKNKFVNVKFLGKMNREELIEEYQNCIATVVPSNWFEAFGMVNIEAFINGKPVIASNIGGIPEIVENNINGLLFEPGNVEQLRECILRYWNNPQLVIDHGINAYQTATKNYTESVYYKKLMHVYNEVINTYKSNGS